MPPNKLIAHIN